MSTPTAQPALAASAGSVPDGFALLKPSDLLAIGDIVADCEGRWRGPIPPDSDMVGRELREYLCSNTPGALPALRGAARRKSPNASGSGSASHPICKQCRHRWPQDGQPPYHPGSWCYMFRSGKHVDEQGYCGQWRGVPSPEAPGSVTEAGR
jgi:hypothetical protein